MANPPNHGPNKLDNYLSTHYTIMRRYLDAGDFVGEDTVTPRPFTSYERPGFLLEGEIGCKGRIVISVAKFLEILERIDGNVTVETRWYSYNVLIRGERNIFRYDNQHPEYIHAGHTDEHHKHEYEGFDEAPHSPIDIEAGKWPRLSDVIDEAREWYLENRYVLGLSEDFPELGLR